MKKVTTNITFGQILFILFTFCFASLMFFYLGAKFGPQILEISIAPVNSRESILPDESVALEIQELLNTKKHDFVFQEALESNHALKQDEVSKTKTTSVEVDATVATKQILQDLKASQTIKTADLAKLPPTTQKEFWTTPTVSISDNSKSIKAVEQPKPDKIVAAVVPPKPTPVPPVKKVEKPPIKVIEAKVDQPQVIKTDLTDEVEDTSEDSNAAEETSVATSGSSYRLQLGSYSDIKKAQTAVQLWQKRGYSATVVETKIPGKGNWYRVRIGGYSDMSEATNAQRLIMRKYRQSVSVVNLN